MTSGGAGDGGETVQIDDDEWFDDGGAFDSAEDLTAALFAMVGGAEADVVRAVAAAATAERGPEEGGGGPLVLPGVPAFELGAGQRSGGTGWAERVAGAPARGGWSIRHSVKVLKLTEEVLRRLREDAVEVTWRAAAVAVAQVNEERPGRA